MSSFVKKIVLAAALLVMPLQGVAATLAVLLCHGDAQAHASHSAHQGEGDHSAHSNGAAHSHGDNHHEDGNAQSVSFHLCCNLTASAPATVTVAAYLPDFPVQHFTPDSLHDSFVPELPQRPPLV
jgi:hypothetical protein